MSALSAAILRALTDDQLVDNAAEVNRKIARDQMDQLLIRDKIRKAYS